jgi:purine-binding chemotaxis protein CheW
MTTHEPSDLNAEVVDEDSRETAPDLVESDSSQGDVPSRARPSRRMNREEKSKILRERALRLAQAPDTDAELKEEYVEVIEFLLGDERYAIDVGHVREVYPLKDLILVPCTPSFIMGIINVRGQVVSVTDLRQIFELPRKELTAESKVLILTNANMEFGILADVVLAERRVPVADIQTGLATLSGPREKYIKGVTSERLVLLDGERLLSDESIVVHEEVGE